MRLTLVLLTALTFGCAFGSGRVGDCEAKGFAIGKSEVKAICSPTEYVPLIETTSLLNMTEDPEMVEVIKAVYENNDEFWKEYLKTSYGGAEDTVQREEQHVRIGGGPPTTSFWGTIGDVALSVVTFFVTRGAL